MAHKSDIRLGDIFREANGAEPRRSSRGRGLLIGCILCLGGLGWPPDFVHRWPAALPLTVLISILVIAYLLARHAERASGGYPDHPLNLDRTEDD